MKLVPALFAWSVLSTLVGNAVARTAPSQERAAPVGVTAADAKPLDVQAAEADREARRILHLANGQVIRVLARRVDGRWEYKHASGWKPLEPGLVTSVELERDVLAAWRARRAKLDSRRTDERAALAADAVERGLLAEGWTELEAVLAVEPDHRAALATLRENRFVAVPSVRVEDARRAEALEELLRFGASSSTCGRELAANELAAYPDRAGLEQRLGRELGSNVVARRAFAVLALRRVFPTPSDARPLIVRSVLDASEEVRRGSALALKAANEPALCAPVVRALASRSPLVRVRAAEALGVMGYAAAVEPLVAALRPAPSGGGSDVRPPHANIFVGRQVAYVQDFDVEVASFQSVADPQVNVYLEGMTTEAAVLGIQQVDFATESAAIGRALGRITGADPGNTARAWREWWEKDGGAWLARAYAATATTSAPAK